MLRIPLRAALQLTDGSIVWLRLRIRSNIGFKSFDQVADFNFTMLLGMMVAMAFVWGDRNSVDNLDNTILAHAVGHNHAGKAIHLDRGKAKNAGNINADVRITKQGWQIKGLVRQWFNLGFLVLVVSLIVECISVQCGVGHNVVLENGLEILATLASVEQKGVGSWAQPTKGSVGGDEDGATLQVDAMDKLDKVGLFIGQQQS